MYLFLIVAAFVVLILLIFFLVLIGVKACFLLDGLAKRAEVSEYPDGLDFGTDVFKKQNRTKKQSGIRGKMKKRREEFYGRAGGNT